MSTFSMKDGGGLNLLRAMLNVFHVYVVVDDPGSLQVAAAPTGDGEFSLPLLPICDEAYRADVRSYGWMHPLG